jgi:hypothetical protein
MGFYSGPRAESTSPFFMAMDRVRTYPAAMRDFKNLLRCVSPDDTDYGLNGLRAPGRGLESGVGGGP